MNLSQIRSAVKMARKAGMDDENILVVLMKNEYGGVHRREIVVEWGKSVGLDATSALRRATELGLIPTSQSPETWKREPETPLRTNKESVPE